MTNEVRQVAVYKFGPTKRLHEGSFADWDFDVLGGDDYQSPRARTLYRALGTDPSDEEYYLAVHRRDGRWGLFGLQVEGHTYAVEE